MSAPIDFEQIFSQQVLRELFPPERSDEYFEALFGDAEEGAFDIVLSYSGSANGQLLFELQLHERAGHCLACNLTQGLPQVFSRHPVINVRGLVEQIDNLLGNQYSCGEWALANTQHQSNSLHVVPLTISIS